MKISPPPCVLVAVPDRQIDRLIDRQIEIQMDRQTDIQIDRKIDRQTDRQRDMQRKTQRERWPEIDRRIQPLLTINRATLFYTLMGNIGLLICHSIDLQTLCAEVEHFTTLTKKSLKFTVKQQRYNQTSKGKFPKSFSFIHPASYEEFWSQDFGTD